jgi:hypothetical protein
VRDNVIKSINIVHIFMGSQDEEMFLMFNGGSLKGAKVNSEAETEKSMEITFVGSSHEKRDVVMMQGNKSADKVRD